ncbi:MAG: amidohydrolase family protein [Hamadaea sp.]|nr:amidohydrolase family protein [Hamadaea sp.]
MSSVLLTNAHVIPGDGGPERPGTDVLVVDGMIAAVGEGLPASGGAEVIDAAGHIVMPGMVDTHRHVWQTPLRGTGADMTLPDYLREILGRALPSFRPEDTLAATRLGATLTLDAGITTVFDWSNTTMTPEHTDAAVAGFGDVGIRAVIAHGHPDREKDVRRLAELTGLVTGALAVLGPDYGSWDESVRQIELARELGIMVSMHAGGGPGSALKRLHTEGLLGPDLQFVHLNDVTEDNVRRLVDAGAAVSVTPLVEALMGHGASAYGRFRDHGGRPGLGVDVVINSPVDLFEAMRDTLRTERLRTGAMPPAGDLIQTATLDGARAIGLADQIGSVTVGKRADLIVLSGLSHLAGTTDCAGAVVTTLGPSNVRDVLVDGRILKRDGTLTTSAEGGAAS